MISTASTTDPIGQGRTTAARAEPDVGPSTAKDTLARGARAHESHRLPGTLASAVKARRLVGDFLDRLQHNGLAEAATLAISEIVTNAVTHGRPPVHLDLTWLTGGTPTLRVDVHDHGHITLHAVAGEAADEAESGRGLFIVENVTDRWGLTPHPVHGTHTWFEIEAATA